MLTIHNVCKKYGSRTILNNVSLSVSRGEIALILGASGTGKSTLLRVLNNLETIDSGVIQLDFQLLDLSTVNQNHTIGMVFQQFNLFEHFTVLENITFPLEKSAHKSKKEALEVALQIIEEYGLTEQKNSYPSQLSGGQKQRVALARALVLKPKIVCLDEPTSALDPQRVASVAEIINELAAKQYTVLIASHDVRLLEKLDCTIYLMEQGSIIASTISSAFKQDPASLPQLAEFIALAK